VCSAHVAVFCSSLIACFLGVLLRYCLNDFETVTVSRSYYWYCFCFRISHALTFYIIIVIIIIIIIISFMQGIYTYIPETNHVPREYSVSAILSLLFVVSISLVHALALLYFYVRNFRSMLLLLLLYSYPMAQKPLVDQGLLFFETSRHRHATLCRTPLDEWSAHHRDL